MTGSNKVHPSRYNTFTTAKNATIKTKKTVPYFSTDILNSLLVPIIFWNWLNDETFGGVMHKSREQSHSRTFFVS